MAKLLRTLIKINQENLKNAKKHQKKTEKLNAQRAEELTRKISLNLVGSEDARLRSIVSFHKNEIKPIDWKERSIQEKPRLEDFGNQSQILELETKKASLIARAFNLTKKFETNKKSLINQLKEIQVAEYSKAVKDWQSSCSFADRILKYDLLAYKEQLSQTDILKSCNFLGTSIEFKVVSSDRVIANLNLYSMEVIPESNYKVLKSGDVKKQELNVSRRNEIYRDYACSATIRVAQEIFSQLPVGHVQVNTFAELMSLANGSKEIVPIISVNIPILKHAQINYSLVKSFDCFSNFHSRINFKKSTGSSAITILSDELDCDLNSLDGLSFEQYVGNVFAKLGYEVQNIRGSGDFGVDLILTYKFDKIAVQVKRSINPISRRAIADAVAGAKHHGCNLSWVVTNSSYSTSAIEFAKSTNCRLIDGSELRDLSK